MSHTFGEIIRSAVHRWILVTGPYAGRHLELITPSELFINRVNKITSGCHCCPFTVYPRVNRVPLYDKIVRSTSNRLCRSQRGSDSTGAKRASPFVGQCPRLHRTGKV